MAKKTISINFANPSNLATAPIRIGLFLIGLASIVLLIVQIQQLRAEIKRHTVTPRSAPAQNYQIDPKLITAWKNAQAIQTQLQTPWLEMLNQLSEIKTQYSEINIVRLTPNIDKGEVILLVEANNFADVIGFLAALNANKNFQAATLQSQQKAEASTALKQLFTLQFKWPANVGGVN